MSNHFRPLMRVPRDAAADHDWQDSLARAGDVPPPATAVVDDAIARVRQAADAEASGAHDGLLQERAAAARARSRRRRTTAVALGSAAAVLVTALAITAPWVETTQQPDLVATGQGPLPVDGGEAASCAFVYSPEVLAEQVTFAFDGTITGIDPGGIVTGNQVTFEVNSWLRGPETDAPSSITLPMAPAEPPTAAEGTTQGDSRTLDAPSYTVGTRLLVAGASRFGGGALKDPVVWGCDFTRYYDRTTAEQWVSALE